MNDLARRAWADVSPHRETLVVPVGATEQHGPHLPLSTDTDIAVALAERLARRVAGVVIAPPIAYGSSGEHQDFPGTLSIGGPAIELTLVELVRSASRTFRRVLLLNCHGGNEEAIGRAVGRLRGERRDVRAWSPAATWGGDAHAGRVETSVMLALDSGRVRMDRATAGDRRPLAELLPEMRARGVAAVSANGVLGDPAGSSAAEGEELLTAAMDALRRWLGEWHAADGVSA
jgi:mycofactocin precursor peptide peptidase